MKKVLAMMAAALISTAAMAQAPAFPGAEGHGRYVTGGRGGEVRHVTNLNDSGEGSLRAAVSDGAKKIIVFDVAGVIALDSELKMGANTTIEGQTAPFPGITLRYNTVRPGGNSIIRFIRFRRGAERNSNDGADATWQRNLNGLILDHCSMSWSTDELASFYDNNNFTMQWCMLGEGLNAGHSKGAHSYGGIWGGKLASFHHNFLGFVQNRAPRFCGARYNWTGYKSNEKYKDGTYQWENAVQAENVDFRNCVMYNWGTGGCYGGPGGGYINIVNNYYKAGPGTSNKTRVTQIDAANSGNSEDNSTYWGLSSRYYINGNYVTAAPEPQNYDWKGVTYSGEFYDVDGEKYCEDSTHFYGKNFADTATINVAITAFRKEGHRTIVDTLGYRDARLVKVKLDKEGAPIGEITTHSAENAYDAVLAYAGASLFRDAIDKGYVDQTIAGEAWYSGSVQTTTKGIIDVSEDNKAYYDETTEGWTGTKNTFTDADNDGMPDEWEVANGLNPNDASDAVTYTLDSKGYYTNIEVYANSLVEELVKAENATGEANFTEYFPEVIAPVSAGIDNTDIDLEAASTTYYNIAGQRVDASTRGIIVVKKTFANGKSIVKKVIR